VKILIALITIFIALCLNELYWRKRNKHNELNRKLVHILVGTFSAFWPFFLSFQTIKYLSLAYLSVVIISKHFGLFKSIHQVERHTLGEVFFAISVGLLAFITNNKWLYATSLLQMSLADGLAAVVGTKYGKSNQYKINGSTKSIIGTLTFFVTSLSLLIVFHLLGHLSFSYFYLLLVSLIAAIIENISIQGLDNLLVPLIVLILIK
jgi:dolichol kinase